MSLPLWTHVDGYIESTLFPPDPVLADVLAANAAAGLPDIGVSPPQGRLLALLVQMLGARSVLEIGTLGGYSTIWMARALAPGGRLVSLEAEPAYAEVARRNLARAGMSEVVEVRVGRAIETLPALAAERAGPFDLIFIDADKPSNPDYLFWSLRLARPGTLIVCDNVVRDGAVADGASDDPRVLGVRRFFDLVAENPRLTTTVIQTVGAKGYDGFALTRVTA